ncbi:MAG: hypothetical protein WEB63_01070 [Cucumibacter sp.]
MNMFKQLALAGAASLALATGAQATDLYTAVPSTPMYDEAGFDWEGFYFGVQKGFWFGGSNYWSFDKVAGINFLLGDNFLVGAEAMGGIVTDFSGNLGFEAYLRGRLGLVLGGDVLIYKLGEIGYVNGTSTFAFGGGLEIAVGDRMSVRGELRGIGDIGDPGFDYAIASIGVLWHAN